MASQIQALGTAFRCAANIYFTECAESRSKALLDQARAILTNRHDNAQHFFTHRLTIEIAEESGCVPLVVLWKFGAIRAFVEMDESLEPQNDAFLFTVKIL